MLIRIGSRKSDLARIQAYAVGEALQSIDSKIQIEYKFSASLGDKNLTEPLWKAPEQGIFTQDLFKDITSNRTDINVHSWKDLPTEENDLTSIVATLNRENPHDMVLIKKESIDNIKKTGKLILASSSPRRIYNIDQFLPSLLPFEINEIEWKDVRGNIQTRLKKVFELEYHGIIVAKAAIDRLIEASMPEFLETGKLVKGYLEQCHWMLLPLSLNPCAAAQGGLAIEARRNDHKIIELLEKINQKDTFETINQERQIHSQYGGGCHQKLGITLLPFHFGNILSKKGHLDDHGEIHYFGLQNSNTNIPDTIDENKFYPATHDPQLFKRENLNYDQSKLMTNLLVSRANALPVDYKQQDGQILWTAGLTTWKKLAKRGYWVHGSNESLGDELFQQIHFDALYMYSKDWSKVTHQQSPKSFNSLPLVPTYQLVRTKNTIEWEKKEYCYWKSGSAFLQALKEYPQIIDAQHICGPGITYRTLLQHIPEDRIILDLDFQHFFHHHIN